VPDIWLFLSIIVAVLAMAVGLLGSPAWAIRSRVNARLNHRRLAVDDSGDDSPLSDAIFSLVDIPAIAADFKELEPALDATGRSPFQARLYYLLWCWLFPVLATIIGFQFLDFVMASIVLLLAFFLPRRAIRAAGNSAEKQQNREAIELCYMTRMLMEAGLSPERSLKLISHQARDLMPLLINRVDRFNRVMESGADRTAAFEELGRNRNLTVLRSYVALMKQSGTLGSKVSGGLDQIVAEAQHQERSKLKEETNKIGARMTVIMMLLMLPSLFLLIGGPAVLSILDAFQ